MSDKLVVDFNDSKFVQSLSFEITVMFVEDAKRIIELLDVEKQNKKNGSEFISILNKYLSIVSKPLTIGEFIEDVRKTVLLVDTECRKNRQNDFLIVVGKYVTPIVEGMRKKHEDTVND